MRQYSAVKALIILILVAMTSAAVCAEPTGKHVTMDVKDTPFPELIRLLFSGRDMGYSVDPALKGLKVTINLQDVAWGEAVKVIAKSAGVNYTVSNNTYMFRPGSQTIIRTGPTSTGPVLVQVIGLSFVSPGDAASLLNAAAPAGLVSVTATNTNKLLIKGTAEAIAEAKNIIKEFDDESALPRAVRLSATLQITGPGPAPVELKTESVGPEATSVQLGINSTGSQKLGSSIASYAYMVDLRLTPTVLSDGTVSLTGSGGIDCSIPYSGNNSVLQSRLSRSFEVAASATAGQPVVVASASGTGSGDAGFNLSVTATIEKGRIAAPGGAKSPAGTGSPSPSKGGSSTMIKPDDAQVKAADALLQQIWQAKPGQPKFAAIDAVVRKYKESDVATRNAIGWLCVDCMTDGSRQMPDRWPCCYVVTRARYDNGYAAVVKVLLHDPIEMMRAVAAEALGEVSDNPTARDALVNARKTEKSDLVLKTIAKYIK